MCVVKSTSRQRQRPVFILEAHGTQKRHEETTMEKVFEEPRRGRKRKDGGDQEKGKVEWMEATNRVSGLGLGLGLGLRLGLPLRGVVSFLGPPFEELLSKGFSKGARWFCCVHHSSLRSALCAASVPCAILTGKHVRVINVRVGIFSSTAHAPVRVRRRLRLHGARLLDRAGSHHAHANGRTDVHARTSTLAPRLWTRRQPHVAQVTLRGS